MPCRRVALSLLLLILASPGVRAQGFEGTLRQRTITVRDAALDRLIYGDDGDAGDEGAPDDETEAAYMRRIAARLFAVPLDRVLAVAREEEGEIEEVTVYLKGNQLRSDFADSEGGTGFVLVDLATGALTMVNTTARYYVQWTRPEMDAQLRAMGLPTPAEAQAGAGADLAVRDLGTTATIAGARCRGFEITVPDEGVVWGWVTDGFPELQRAIREIGEQAAVIFSQDDEGEVDPEDLLMERGFPMRTQRYSGATGSPRYEIEEVLSIERGAVPASTFTVPAGYARKTLQELWGR